MTTREIQQRQAPLGPIDPEAAIVFALAVGLLLGFFLGRASGPAARLLQPPRRNAAAAGRMGSRRRLTYGLPRGVNEYGEIE